MMKFLKRFFTYGSVKYYLDEPSERFPKIVHLPNEKWAVVTKDGTYVDDMLYEWDRPDHKKKWGMFDRYETAKAVRLDYLSANYQP